YIAVEKKLRLEIEETKKELDLVQKTIFLQRSAWKIIHEQDISRRRIYFHGKMKKSLQAAHKAFKGTSLTYLWKKLRALLSILPFKMVDFNENDGT
ncbi:hypothetical protein H5410_046850, partial [Solanum commersonii]